jgi:rSAM-associated Gly-rich repeat protein
MRLLTSSQLLGFLLILGSIPVDLTGASAAALSGQAAPAPVPGSLEARMQRISLALRNASPQAEPGIDRLEQDAVSWWRNGGFRNGGFRNGGFRDGGFGNGGFRNGGFRNGFWVNI